MGDKSGAVMMLCNHPKKLFGPERAWLNADATRQYTTPQAAAL
jgi:hypothetical protein